MARLSIVLLLAAFAGCHKNDCESIGTMFDDALAKLAPKQMSSETREEVNRMMAAVKGATVARCAADKWSADTVKCVRGAKSVSDDTECASMFTAAQKQALEKDLRNAWLGNLPQVLDSPILSFSPGQRAAMREAKEVIINNWMRSVLPSVSILLPQRVIGTDPSDTP